jgi:hypothetical protein
MDDDYLTVIGHRGESPPAIGNPKVAAYSGVSRFSDNSMRLALGPGTTPPMAVLVPHERTTRRHTTQETASIFDERPGPITLVAALHAAETLETFHLQQVVQTAGERQAYHLDMAERCEADVADIKQHLAADSGGARRAMKRRR